MSQSPDADPTKTRKVTTNRLRKMKERGEKIAALTFPAPEGGSVRVVYPFLFASD